MEKKREVKTTVQPSHEQRAETIDILGGGGNAAETQQPADNTTPDAQQAEGLDVSKAHSGGGVAGPRPATPKGDALNNDPADHATPDVLPK